MTRMLHSLAVSLALAFSIAGPMTSPLAPVAAAAERPNIVWITSEDNGPQLGCYGDEYATTPHIDGLAKRGTVYLHAWSNAPVCAPARTTIITGMYPTTLGAQHMRSSVPLPEHIKLYPQYLCEAGYYCTNNRKEDYNVRKPGKVWDDSSGKAHYKNRKEGQPFFAVFNFTTSHESQIRRRPHEFKHDPAKVRVPAYHPDTPEVRKDWAQYYDKLTEMDKQVGGVLKELEEANLLDDTIIFYYGDHGPGMPRSKRWPYNSGLHVPMVVSIPEKFKHLRSKDYKTGGKSDRLVSFVDLAPTVLSLIGVKPPEHMQGKAFLGEHEAEPRAYLHGFRGRMDERVDMVRCIRDKQYIYIRNYMPHRRYGEHVQYMFITPTTRVWKQMFDEGKLNQAQSHFWKPKPSEELYDLHNDPDEVINLVNSEERHETLVAMRTTSLWTLWRTNDTGFLPEPMLHARTTSTPYALGQDQRAYRLPVITTVAGFATDGETALKHIVGFLDDEDAAARYWAALGMTIRGREAVAATRDKLRGLLKDESPSVRIAAAEALARYGDEEDVTPAVKTLVELGNANDHGVFVAILALNSLDAVGDKARPFRDQIAKLPVNHPDENKRARMGGVLNNLVTHIAEKLK